MAEQLTSPAIVRFAPSPTGAMHLGTAMIALANAQLARATGGRLVFRIDDTDRERSTDHDAEEFVRLLGWLGIGWDEGPIRQSERSEFYASAVERLLADDAAYPCFCDVERLEALRAQQVRDGLAPRYDGRCRSLDPVRARADVAAGAPHVVRLRVDDARDVVIHDLLRGDVTIPGGAFGDPVLRRTDGSAAYLLASVVDDVVCGITHVLRGEDHLTNTAVQIVLFERLGHAVPAFLHVALIRDEHGAKLSKRAPMGTLDELVRAGYLPRTVRRYLAELLGQGSADPLDGPARLDVSRLPTGAPRVDRTRLDSIGREDVATIELAELVVGTAAAARGDIDPLLREFAAESATRVEFEHHVRCALEGPLPADLAVAIESVPADDVAVQRERWSAALDSVDEWLDSDALVAGEDWAPSLLADVRAAAKESGIPMRDVLKPIRIAVSASAHGPALDLLLAAIGPEETQLRVRRARSAIGASAAR